MIRKQLTKEEYMEHLEEIGAYENQDLSKIPKKKERQTKLSEVL